MSYIYTVYSLCKLLYIYVDIDIDILFYVSAMTHVCSAGEFNVSSKRVGHTFYEQRNGHGSDYELPGAAAETPATPIADARSVRSASGPPLRASKLGLGCAPAAFSARL